MSNTNPDPGGKRRRLFGRDPLPGFVFSLDTSCNNLRILGTSSCVLPRDTRSTSTGGGARERAPSSAGSATPSSLHRDSSKFSPTPNNDSSDDPTPSQTRTTPHATAASSAESAVVREGSTAAPSSVSAAGRHTAAAGGREVPAASGSDNDTIPVAASAAAAVSLQRQDRAPDTHRACALITPPPAALSLPVPEAGSGKQIAATDGNRRRKDIREAADAPGKSAHVTVAAMTTPRTQGTTGGSGGGDVSTGAAAASLVASFLKRGSTAPLPAAAVVAAAGGASTCSPIDRPRIPSASIANKVCTSPPKTPTPLASLVTGVPLGSGGSASAGSSSAGSACYYSGDRRRAGFRSPNVGATGAAGAENRIQSPRRGGNRLFHNEWAPSLKRRRRILHFPKPNDPVGTRILYWVRGNYRVKDNLGLSVAFWLSTQLRLPLQAVTFVDPAIRRSMPSRPTAGSSVNRTRRLPGGGDAHDDAERQELPFRMAVEVSALCEMEEALRALNVPLVAVACAESEIPLALACWCGGGTGSSSTHAGARPPPAGSTAAATNQLPTEGSVHITIMDECYHPRQLSLSEKVRDALRGAGALYAMDSSCVYPVNTSGGGGGGGRAGAGTGARGANEMLSPEEFRQAQDDCLPAVLTDLTPKPRLPLEVKLQNQMFIGGEKRAILPREFERRANTSTGSAVAVLSWGELREVSARRFPGFDKPISRHSAGFTKDLISVLGGGERVGEAALRQTLELGSASSPDGQRPADTTWAGPGRGNGGNGRALPRGKSASLESEVAGLGFGGCLLHLLRLGSISSLFVVQTLLCRLPNTGTEGDRGKEPTSKMCESRRHLLDELLKREYALYRSRLHHREMGRAVGNPAAHVPTTRGGSSSAAAKGQEWRGKDHWMGIVPAWVWEELKREQRDARQHQHSPGDIRSAGSTVPSSVHDEVFSAIQVRLTTGARLPPSLAPYWARSVVTMMLIPSQAISLLVDLAEELCLGATHAGDVVPDLLDSAFGVLREPPPTSAVVNGARVPSPALAGTRREMPIFRRLPHPTLATEAGLRSAFGGRDGLARFLSPSPVLPRPSAS